MPEILAVPRAVGPDDLIAELRRQAGVLRRLLPAVVGVLAGVRAADSSRAWRCRWRERVAARVARWQRALELGAEAIRDRAALLDRLADWYEEQSRARPPGAGPSAVAMPPPPGWARSAAGRSPVGDELAALARELAGQPPDLPVPTSGDGGAETGSTSFDPVLLAVLAARLREASVRSGALSRALDQAMALAGLGLTGGTGVVVGPGPAGGVDPMCVGLRLVGAEAPRVAAGIDRRMAHFAAAEAVVRESGVLIDRSVWFVDADPLAPSGPVSVAAAAAELVARIGTDPDALTGSDLTAVAARLRGFPPAARQAVISRLRGRPLAVLAARAASVVDATGIGTLGFVPALASLADDLLAGAPSAMVREILAAFPGLEPAYPRPAGPVDPAEPADRVVGVDRTRDPLVRAGAAPDDVGQGSLADCYLAAALIGLARQDPELLRERLRRNGNGTVTVTLWEHAPVAVTVSATLPARRLGPPGPPGAPGPRVGGPEARPVPPAFDEIAMDGDDAAGRPELWPAIYEKAYARLHGGYPAIAFGRAAVALRTLTGRPVPERAADGVDVAGLAAMLAAREVVIVSTRRRTRPAGLVAAHAYTVLAVDRARRRVLLRNPWDPPSGETNERWYDWSAISPDVQRIQHGATR